MKKIKLILIWILVSIVLQITVLSYINFKYLPGRGAVTATEYHEEVPEVKSRSIKLSKGAEDIKVSFDGLHVAYKVKNDLFIVSTDNGRTIKKLDGRGGRLSYFRWLQDRDMLVYSTKEPDGDAGRVGIYTYEITPDIERSFPNIKGLPKDSEIIGIELSPLTNVVYPVIKISDTEASIYKFDILDNLSYVMKVEPETIIKGNMYTDMLIYQRPGKEIIVRNGDTGREKQIPIKSLNYLIATDDNDFVYAAELDHYNNISSIYIGKEENDTLEWRIEAFEKPVSKLDVFITANGSIYTADRQKRTVKSLKSSNAAEYVGELITVTDDYVISMSDRRLLMDIFKK